MEAVEAVAAKRKILVELLSMCIERSKVSEVVNGDTIRMVLKGAVAEMWREGEFRLDAVWKILSKEPGIDPKDASVPLLVFKTYETELGVPVILPEELQSVSPEERMILRGAIGLSDSDFAAALETLREIAAEEESSRNAKQLVSDASLQGQQQGPEPKGKRGAGGARVITVIGAAVLLFVGMPVSLYWTIFRDKTQMAEVAELAPILQLTGGRRREGSMVATISDPKWANLSRDERRAVAEKVFDVLTRQGVQVLTLLDSANRPSVLATDIGGIRSVQVN